MIAVMPNVSLLNLIERAKNKEASSQRELYKKFFGMGMAVCMRYCNSREEALEVYNNGWLKIFDNLHTFQTQLSFSSWIKRILINASIDYYRQQKKHYYHQDLSNAYALSSETEGPDHNLMHADLLEILNTIPDHYRISFTLFAIEGYSHQEIAETMGISVGTSKSNVSRARDLLRKKLAEKNAFYYDQK